MNVLHEGNGKLVDWHDPDEARAWTIKQKSRRLIDKRMSPKLDFVHFNNTILRLDSVFPRVFACSWIS